MARDAEKVKRVPSTADRLASLPMGSHDRGRALAYLRRAERFAELILDATDEIRHFGAGLGTGIAALGRGSKAPSAKAARR